MVKIIEHRDRFQLLEMVRHGPGNDGLAARLDAFLRRKVKENAQKSLDKFIAKYPEYQ
ncbi:MAG: hypothetical protein U5J95_02540 [Balneolaceae bacterium]|nr:hypothetical protein [Balneolaceae bacterium]